MGLATLGEPLRVEVEHGYYLIAWGELVPPEVYGRLPPSPALVVAGGALVVGTFHATASVSLYHSAPAEFEPDLLDTESWDRVLETAITADAPLRVVSWDGTPAYDDPQDLTDEPGTWAVRLYARRVSFFADEVPGRESEDHFVEMWRVDA